MKELKVIARIKSDFPTKFGIPRQSGLVEGLEAAVLFEREYGAPEAFRGIEGFSHLWLLWGFSEVFDKKWSFTVRPPRLGGNKRVGVFATRSPYRPNPIALSAVRLKSVGVLPDGRVYLKVSGADVMDGTPVYDIKPYLPLSDSVPDAVDGFAGAVKDYALQVVFSDTVKETLTAAESKTLSGILEQDPRPSYQHDDEREYGFLYANKEIKFKVKDGILTVIKVIVQ